MSQILSFNCDRCGKQIAPESGRHIVDQAYNALLVCGECDTGQNRMSSDMDTALVQMLLSAGWLDADLRPTARLLSAAKKYAASTVKD